MLLTNSVAIDFNRAHGVGQTYIIRSHDVWTGAIGYMQPVWLLIM